MDPQEVGRRTFNIFTILICLPNTIVGIYNLKQGLHVAGGAAAYTQTEYQGEGVRFVPTYSLLWTSLFLILSFFAYAFIPLFIKNTQTSQNHQPTTQRTNSLQRYLVGSFWLLIILVISVVFSEQKVPSPRPLTIQYLVTCSCFHLIYFWPTFYQQQM
jgi:ABC-type phosphate transport system permease subunit